MNITLTPAQLAFIDAIRTHGPAMGLDITQEKYTRESMRQIALKFKGNKRIPDWIARDLARRPTACSCWSGGPKNNDLRHYFCIWGFIGCRNLR